MRANDVESARRALANGNDAARWRSFGALNPYASEIDDVTIAELRLQQVTGASEQSLPQIRAALDTAEAAGRRRRALRLLFLESQALEGAGRRRDASATFDQAVMRAADGRMVRVLADDAWMTEALVGRSAITGEPRSVGLLREWGRDPLRQSRYPVPTCEAKERAHRFA